MWLLLACTPEATDGDPVPADSAAPQTSPVPPLLSGRPMIPGPADPNHDPVLAAHVDRYDRLFLALSSAPYGLSLDAYVPDRAPVEDWLDQGTGYENADLVPLVTSWDEWGDLGMFGGVAAVAESFRYALERQDPDGVPGDTETARAAFVRMAEAVHVMHDVTGRPGSIVRGLGRRDMAGLEDVQTVPLFDAAGDPLPADKQAVWREDGSGRHPDYVWYDDTSKDQFIGWILALGWAWQVAKDDPDVDPALVAALEADALAVGRGLMEPGPCNGRDLTLVDADGRCVTFFDLNAEEVAAVYVGQVINPFNAVMALGSVKTLAVVSGDPELADFYRELAFDRGYVDILDTLGAGIWLGYGTNYSNVNMSYVAVLSWLRFESDEALLDAGRTALGSLWAEGTARAPWDFHDAWFTLITAGWLGVDDAALDESLSNLLRFPRAPWWDDAVENCDATEIAAGICLAVDGETTIELYGTWEDGTFVAGSARNAYPVAATYVPQHLRTPSNFEWRSDPYRVNGGGSDRLNPGGDLRAAYWLGRVLPRALAR